MTVREDAKRNNQEFALSDNFESSTDLIRQNVNSFYINRDDAERLSFNLDAPFKFYHIDGLSPNRADMDISKNPAPDSELIILEGTSEMGGSIEIPLISEKVTITPNLDLPTVYEYPFFQTPQSLFEEFAEELRATSTDAGITVTLGPYIDYFVELNSPIIYSSNINNRSLIQGDVEYTFNYGSETYESAIPPDSISESKLLNFYKYFGDKETRTQFTTYYDKYHGTMAVAKIQTTPDPFKASKANALSSSIASPSILAGNDIKNFFITKENYIDSTALLESKRFFPFFNQISFSNPPRNAEEDDLRSSIYDSGFSTAFCDCMNSIVSSFEEQTALMPELIEEKPFSRSFLSSSYLDATQTDFVEKYEIQNINLKMIDALALLKKLYSAPISEDTITSATKGAYKDFSTETNFIKERISSTSITESTKMKYAEGLEEIRVQYQKLLNNESRTYKEILLGNIKSYTSKVLFYRIAKYNAGATNFPIQNFWIPSENTYLGLDYIDSQVKYGKRYRYKVYAYKMMVGSEYLYEEQISFLSTSYGVGAFGDAESGIITGGPAEYLGDIEESVMKKLRFISDVRGKLLDSGLPTTKANAVADALIATALVEIGNTKPPKGFAGMRASYQNNIQPFTDFMRSIINTGQGKDRNGTVILREEIDESIIEKFQEILDKETNLYGSKGFGTAATVSPTSFSGIDRAGGLLDFVQWNTNVVRFLSRFRDTVLSVGKFNDFDAGDAALITGAVGTSISLLGGVAGIGILLAGVVGVFALLIDYISDAVNRKKIQTAAQSAGLDGTERIHNFLNNTAYSIDLFDTDTKDKSEKLSKAEIETGLEKFKTRARILEKYVQDFIADQEDYLELVNLSFTVEKTFDKLVYNVTTKPTLKLIEIPYYESVGTIVDNPPLFPNINFVTYKGIDDRISFFMNSGQGSLEQVPVVFSESEAEFYKTFREARKLNDFQEILYKSDEFENLGTSFEIRRLATPPKSYDDFKEATVQTVSKTISTGEILPAATFMDKIVPNKKYYYMFRVFDRRFNVSNPTAVYEIQLVENSGAIYPLINSYEFPEEEKKINKSFKRLFNIVPRLSQVLPTNLNAETYGDLSTGITSILGTEDESLFGETFKIRLSSKKTGKVVDLNVNFSSTIVSKE